MIKKLGSKRAQEEMIGFVLIIVLVAIIALVFLAIGLRKQPASAVESRSIEDFLYACKQYSTTCQPNAAEFYNFDGLVKACYDNEYCLDGNNSCDVLNETAFGLIESSWKTGKEAMYKGYVFRISKDNRTILYLSKGNETSSKMGEEVYVSTMTGNIAIRMDVFS